MKKSLIFLFFCFFIDVSAETKSPFLGKDLCPFIPEIIQVLDSKAAYHSVAKDLIQFTVSEYKVLEKIPIKDGFLTFIDDLTHHSEWIREQKKIYFKHRLNRKEMSPIDFIQKYPFAYEQYYPQLDISAWLSLHRLDKNQEEDAKQFVYHLLDGYPLQSAHSDIKLTERQRNVFLAENFVETGNLDLCAHTLFSLLANRKGEGNLFPQQLLQYIQLPFTSSGQHILKSKTEEELMQIFVQLGAIDLYFKSLEKQQMDTLELLWSAFSLQKTALASSSKHVREMIQEAKHKKAQERSFSEPAPAFSELP